MPAQIIDPFSQHGRTDIAGIGFAIAEYFGQDDLLTVFQGIGEVVEEDPGPAIGQWLEDNQVWLWGR